MSREEFREILLPLTLAMRAEFDAPTWAAYYVALKDIAPQVLRLAVESLLRESREFFPSAGTLRGIAERQRRVLLAAYPYEGCAECEGHIGYRTIQGAAGQPVVERCPCKARHLEMLGRYGLRDAVTQLPGEAGVGENEPVYPTLAQLPQPIQARLLEIAGQKVLR